MKKKHKICSVAKNNLYMLSFIKKATPWYILVTCAISLTAFVDTVSNTWFSKIVFDSMENRSPFADLIITILVLLVFMLISSAVKTFFYHKYSPRQDKKITGYIRSLLFEKTISLDLVYYESPEFYNKYTRALMEADNRAVSVLSSVSQLLYSVVTLLTLFSIIIYLDPVLIIFAFVGAIFSALTSKKLSKIRFDYNYDRTELDRKAAYVDRVFYEPQYAKDMKMNSLHTYFISFYKNIVSNTIKYIKNRSSRIAFWEFIAGIQNVILQIIMTIFLTWRVYSGSISIGDYAALLNSTFNLMFQLQSFTGLISCFYEHSLYIENLAEILNKKPNIEKEVGINIDTESCLQIEFCNVTFSYPNSNHTVLNNVNMVFSSGKRHAIVGHNGAGKSTIIKLILRFYDVDSGAIYVNGRNIKDYNVFSLRKAISTVFQDFQIYAMPISDYILSHKYDKCTEKETVEQALENAGLSHKFEEAKISFNSNLTKEFDDCGIVMSGGEIQKLAIAKAIAKKSGAIIMDEASSALDPISEHEINNRMFTISKGKTVILISHRLSTVKDAEMIYYMENGEVIEAGTHKQLMSTDGGYAHMYRIQSESFSD